ncbi:MAG: hypothetical protein IT452_03010 [Planctomycetia bacterium]|nr:hypothetical protein [Planctomycetia bacterium]
MKRLLSRLFDVEIPETSESEESESSAGRLTIQGIIAGLFISAPAWASRLAAFLF